MAADHPDDDVAALDAIARELYAVPPAEFTAARAARAREAGRALAAQITALRKPSVAAWAVDLMAREGLLGEAIELGAALREAQEGLDAPALADLGRQRRALCASLAGQAAERASDAGVSVSGAARADIERTLTAAMIDADAAAAVLSARLATAIEATGLGDVDLTGTIGGSIPAAASPEPPSDDLAERRARKALERAARDAEREAESAEREHAHAAAREDRAQSAVDRLRARVADLQRELDHTTAELTEAEAALAEAAQATAPAAAEARAAARRADAARAALD